MKRVQAPGNKIFCEILQSRGIDTSRVGVDGLSYDPNTRVLTYERLVFRDEKPWALVMKDDKSPLTETCTIVI